MQQEILDYISGIVNFAHNFIQSQPLWVFAPMFASVAMLFHLLQLMVAKRLKWLAFTISAITALPFFAAWAGLFIHRMWTIREWLITLFSLWAYITLIETVRRDSQAQWLRNIISLTVEIPLLYTTAAATLRLMAMMPDLFVWVNAEDTFWSMVWHCAIIIAGYFAIAYLFKHVIIPWLMPGGSQWSIMLFLLGFYIVTYRSTLDAIDGLYGVIYCCGVVVLFFGGLWAWCVSFSGMDEERCPRCHRYDARYLGSSDGGYQNTISYKTVHESDLLDRHDRIQETRHITNYQHECRHCGAEWTTTLSTLVGRNSTTVGYTRWRYK